MRLLRSLSTVRAGLSDIKDPFYPPHTSFFPPEWAGMLSSAGVEVTPDLAMSLTAMYSGVSMIAYDLATLPLHAYRRRDDGGKDKIQPIYGLGIDSSNGIGSMAYMLRWQPNQYQTACEFMTSMIAQFLLRAKAYAEIAYDRNGYMIALLPRHPDRVRPDILPNGALRYKLIGAAGQTRYLMQNEMLVVRDVLDGTLDPQPRIAYCAQALGTVFAAEKAAGQFFKSGMTASTLATYTGELEDEEEAALHASISRYAAGKENSFGLMLVPDNIKVSNLGVEPDKAQMMLARQFGKREVAEMLHIPPYKLAIEGTQTYASQVQSAVDYVIGCLRPIAVPFEQSFQRDLVLEKDRYFFEFLLDALLRGDPDARASYYEKAIKCRWMRPSEVRLRENMNPDPGLDRLSENDFQPGKSASTTQVFGREHMMGFLAVHDNAMRCQRRERVAVEKLAKKHASDVDGWKASLRDFFGEHAGFVAKSMRLPMEIARAYCAQHGTELEARGVVIHNDDWERCAADDLAWLAMQDKGAAA